MKIIKKYLVNKQQNFFQKNKNSDINNTTILNNLNIFDYFSTKINSKNDNNNSIYPRKNSFDMPIENSFSLTEKNNNFQGKV
jgi:hypothetical protein